jgi:Zn-dependent protease
MKIFDIPVKFDFTFFLIAGLLGASRLSQPALLIEWIAVVLVSILIHEFGHALAGRSFGLTPQIRLYAMGGVTSWAGARDVSHGKDILISLAGPFAGFLFGGAVLALGMLAPQIRESEFNSILFTDLLWVNFGWGLINLLPIFPLDGGQVVRGFEQWFFKRTGGTVTFAVSFLISAAIAIWGLMSGQTWIGILGVWFAWTNASVLVSIYKEIR